jgi:Zn finger protein HypA/HybF involved in hydrogenase expression
MHEGCSGQFQNGQQVADKVRMMGYDTVPLTVPLNLECVQCRQKMVMVTMVTQCPQCRMVYAVTPCHADSARHVQPAGIDY